MSTGLTRDLAVAGGVVLFGGAAPKGRGEQDGEECAHVASDGSMVPQEATADRVSVEPVELIHDREQVSALVEVHAQEIDTLTPLGGTLLRACLQN